MTSFEIERFSFKSENVSEWAKQNPRHTNWPVVYTLSDSAELYIGETLNGASRMRQHLGTETKQHLEQVQVIIDETFNKSVCLDLESFLIRLFAGDGKYKILNGNDGITDADYYERPKYQESFKEIFENLYRMGYFTRTIPQIENSDLFKLSPFKALTPDQAAAVEDILEGLFEDIESSNTNTIVVQGEPGTGKTVLAIYLIKLLCDIKVLNEDEPLDHDSMFADFYQPGHKSLLKNSRIGIVVPQQSLRKSIQMVFRNVPALDPSMVLTPFEVGESHEKFDLLIVDEAHRLSRLAAQAMGTLTKQFRDINGRLFGTDGANNSQLDWIMHQSKHQLFLVDSDQAVRPADLPSHTLTSLKNNAKNDDRLYRLATQMRVRAGSDYVGFGKELLKGKIPNGRDFGPYDLRLFEDFDSMYRAIRRREEEFGLSRLVAGYAWEWKSRRDKSAYDIELGSFKLRWNTTAVDWINSKNALDEVGSIHTVQGYDLNYAGVIIGKDLVFDTSKGKTTFNRKRYFDARGKSNNNILGIKFSNEDILNYVRNIYSVLLTRGIRGTYIFVEDKELRSIFRVNGQNVCMGFGVWRVLVRESGRVHAF